MKTIKTVSKKRRTDGLQLAACVRVVRCTVRSFASRPNPIVLYLLQLLVSKTHERCFMSARIFLSVVETVQHSKTKTHQNLYTVMSSTLMVILQSKMSCVVRYCCYSILLLTIPFVANGFSFHAFIPHKNSPVRMNSPPTTISPTFIVSPTTSITAISTLILSKENHYSENSCCLRGLKMAGGHEMEQEEDDDNDDVDTPIPFVDIQNNNFIECYTESEASVRGIQYTIGVPCDHAVALCSFDTDDQLVPIDLDDPLMDEIYPVAERFVTVFGL